MTALRHLVTALRAHAPKDGARARAALMHGVYISRRSHAAERNIRYEGSHVQSFPWRGIDRPHSLVVSVDLNHEFALGIDVPAVHARRVKRHRDVALGVQRNHATGSALSNARQFFHHDGIGSIL